jgi:hypothetical protein
MAIYEDNATKFVVVLNKKQPVPTLLNALGHTTAGLSAKIGPVAPDYLDYKCPAGGFTSTISRFPFIVLAAPNGSQLRKLTDECERLEIVTNVFVTAMLGTSAAAQLEATANAAADDLEFVAVALFGEAARIDPLTRKFSLWR